MIHQLIAAQRAAGLSIDLLTDDPDLAVDFAGQGVTAVRLHALGGWRVRWMARSLAGRLSPPGLVHCWSVDALPLVQHWLGDLGPPVLLYVTAEAELEWIESRAAAASARALLGRRPAGPRIRLAAATSSLAAAVRSRVSGEWVPAILPGFDRPGRLASASGSRTLGIAWVGRLEAYHGLRILVDAIAILKQREVDVMAVLVGTGDAVHVIWRAIGRRGVMDRISLIDEPLMWDRAVQGADALVVPVRQREVWLAPLAAMALGKIVIASDDQTADWFVPERTAWSFPSGSVTALAERLIRVVRWPHLGAQLAQSAPEYVHQEHSVAGVAAGFAAVYERILAEAERGRAGSAAGEARAG